MSNPTDDELNQAVVKAARIWNENHRFPAQDWNALMAAAAKLENSRKGWFVRDPHEPYWYALGQKGTFDFDTGNSTSEAHAFALCIHTVVNS